MDAGSLVIVHLVHPSEKYWGVLVALVTHGVTVRGINLSSFDDWINAVAYEEEPALGLVTVFFPLHRVERIFLDEEIGQVASMAQHFERRVGMTFFEYLAHQRKVEPSTN
jgi:hypothetical protein